MYNVLGAWLCMSAKIKSMNGKDRLSVKIETLKYFLLYGNIICMCEPSKHYLHVTLYCVVLWVPYLLSQMLLPISQCSRIVATPPDVLNKVATLKH